MTLHVGDRVTVINRGSQARAVHAVVDLFIPIPPKQRKRRPLNPRVNSKGEPVTEIFWAWRNDARVRALFVEKEGLNWCRGHVDGAHLEAAWMLARSGAGA